jgi:hypothetical protein
MYESLNVDYLELHYTRTLKEVYSIIEGTGRSNQSFVPPRKLLLPVCQILNCLLVSDISERQNLPYSNYNRTSQVLRPHRHA